MRNYTCTIVLLGFAALSGCGGSASGPMPAAPAQHSSGAKVPLAGVVTGNFTEYAVPVGATDFTKGPYNTLWFDAAVGNNLTGFTLYRFAEGNGKVDGYTQPPPWVAVSTPLTLTGGRIYLITENTQGPGENPEYLSHSTWDGIFTTGPGVASDEQIGTLVLGSDGKIWFPDCVQVCGDDPQGDLIRSISIAGAAGAAVPLPQFTANQLTPGPGGFMYATASFTNALPPPTPTLDSAVFVISTAGLGSIVHQFALPHGSSPYGIAVGSDHNLWIAEPGINKIARMTPAGTVTQFSVPTPNAGAAWMTPGPDTAVWFTETNGNKIGRITPAGSITEYPIPTPNSGPNGIHYCTTNCPPHGGVWFIETAASKIAKFSSPL